MEDRKGFKDTKGLLLLFFWAKWCTQCHSMYPVLDNIKETYGKKIDIVKWECTEDDEIAKEYNVMSLPSLTLLKDGVPMWSRAGYVSVKNIEEAIDSQIEEDE